MNQETKPKGAGRLIGACVLAIVLAGLSPIIILSELLSLLVVISVPAVCTMALYRWAGKAPAMLSCALQLVFTAQMLGGTFMWMSFCTSILPLFLLVRCDDKPFFTRMKVAVGAFCAGVVAAVAILYSTYGGNMIERVLQLLPQAMRSVPAEALQMPMETLSAALGSEMTVEGFYTLFDNMITSLIPYYQLNLPGLLFSGAIITAVLCAAIGSRMRLLIGAAAAGSHVPLREWFLPASTSSGVLTMVVAGYITYAAGMETGHTLYTTVYSIAVTVFCIQGLASIARRLYGGKMKAGGQAAMLIGFAVLALLGASVYLALYGFASALFGQKGAVRIHMEYKNKNKQ